MDRKTMALLVSSLASENYLHGLEEGSSTKQDKLVDDTSAKVTSALEQMWGVIEAATAYSENELALRALLKKHPTDFTANDRAEIKRRTHMSFHLQNAVLVLTEELKGYSNA